MGEMVDLVPWNTDTIRASMDAYDKKAHCLKETIKLMKEKGKELVENYIDTQRSKGKK